MSLIYSAYCIIEDVPILYTTQHNKAPDITNPHTQHMKVDVTNFHTQHIIVDVTNLHTQHIIVDITNLHTQRIIL